MSSIDNLAKDLYKIMHNSEEKGPKPYEPVGTVVKVDEKDGNVLWVKIPGSDSETPVEKTINANPGDNVRLRVSGGRAWVIGNASNPPTDDTRANQVGAAAKKSIKFVQELSDKDITVNSIRAATGYIDDLYSKNIYTENIRAATGYIEDLTAKHVTTDILRATTGYIDDLTSKHITAEDIEADHAAVGSLEATYAKIADLDVEKGRIDNLEANEVVVHDTLKATNAEVEYLSSDWISTDRLVLTGNNKNNYPPVQITEAEFNVNKTAYWTKSGNNYIQCTAQSVYDEDTQYYVRQSVRAIIEAINNANRYTAASPTQAEFNADKTSYYTYDGSEYIQCKSTDTYSSSTQYYIYDTEILVSKDKLIAASIDVAELSAITANMGELTAGLIKKGNNFINLNTSPATMEFKNRDSWDNSSEGIQFDAQGHLNIKGKVTITSGSNVPSTKDMNDAIDGIEVGGRNLLKNTEVSLSTLGGSTTGGTSTKVIPAGSEITISVMVDADNVVWDTTSSYHRIGCETALPKSGGGKQYVGVWAGKEVSESANIVSAFTGSFHGRVSKTFTLLADVTVDKGCALYIQGVASGTVKVSNIKLELGNKATDWTPAPEDVQAEIDLKKSVHTLNSAYLSTGMPFSTVMGYCEDGNMHGFDIDTVATPIDNVKIGDSVRIKYLVNDIGLSGTIIYVVGTVASIYSNKTTLGIVSLNVESTVIDGGHILTGTLDATKVNVINLDAGKITSGTIGTGRLPADALKTIRTVERNSGATYAAIKSWVESDPCAWTTIVDSTGVRVGDTCRISIPVTDMSGVVAYVTGTVTAVPSKTAITMTKQSISSTTIDGGMILTGKVAANHIETGDIVIGESQVTNLSTDLDTISAKQINTSVRSFTKSQWDTYGTVNRSESWGASGFDNTHISVGDVAYITGYVNDKTSWYAVIFGKVTARTSDAVTMTTIKLAYNSSQTEKYITRIDDAGIFISPTGQIPSSSNRGNSVLINSNGLYVYNNNVEQAYFAGSSAAIGITGKDRIIINTSGLHVYNYYSNAQNEVATFGSTATVGPKTSGHVNVTASGLYVYTGAESTTSNGVAFFGSTARIGASDGKRVEVKTDGVYVYNGETQYGYFGSFARLGDYTSNNVRIDTNGVHINSSTDTVVSEFTSSGASLGNNSDSAVINLCGKKGSIYGAYSNSNKTYTLNIKNTLALSSTNSQKFLYIINDASSSNHSRVELEGTTSNYTRAALIAGGHSMTVYSDEVGISLKGSTYVIGTLESSSVIISGSNIRLKNGVSLQSLDSSGNNYRALVHLNANNNFVLGTNDISGDCFIYRVYTSKTGTVSTVPNVRILDNHRLTRTTHANSSRRYKHDIQDISNKDLDPHNLYNIEVKQFRYNDDIITDPSDCRYNKELVGFIAEQVRDCYPIAVDVNENDECEAWSPQYIVPPMLALIQEQHREIEMLKQRIGGY